MTELTWKNIDELINKVDYDTFEKLCLNSKASDFYVDVRQNPDWDDADGDTTMVCITPKDQFDQVGIPIDQSMNLDHLLPGYVYELMEATYGSEKSVDETKQELLRLGFLESDKFSQIFDELEEAFEQDCLDEDCDD